MADATITIREYDIESLSDMTTLGGMLPRQQVSHLGIVFDSPSFDTPREFNFGSFLNGRYRAAGGSYDFSDTLGGTEGSITNLPPQDIYSMTVSEAFVDAAVRQVEDFIDELASKDIPYNPTPNATPFSGGANSNSAAAYVMRMVGINPYRIGYDGDPYGYYVSLEREFGVTSAAVRNAAIRKAVEDAIENPDKYPLLDLLLADLFSGEDVPNPETFTVFSSSGRAIAVDQQAFGAHLAEYGDSPQAQAGAYAAGVFARGGTREDAMAAVSNNVAPSSGPLGVELNYVAVARAEPGHARPYSAASRA